MIEDIMCCVDAPHVKRVGASRSTLHRKEHDEVDYRRTLNYGTG